jgi:hypothetical protein
MKKKKVDPAKLAAQMRKDAERMKQMGEATARPARPARPVAGERG